MDKSEAPAANGTPQVKNCDSAPVATIKSEAPPTRRINVRSKKCGNYPLTTVEGLTSLTKTFYGVFKQRLHCPGRCVDNKIELWNACPRDVVRILSACDFPEESITVHER